MKLKHDKLFSNFAFKCNLRPYSMGGTDSLLAKPCKVLIGRAFFFHFVFFLSLTKLD